MQVILLISFIVWVAKVISTAIDNVYYIMSNYLLKVLISKKNLIFNNIALYLSYILILMSVLILNSLYYLVKNIRIFKE